MSEPTVTTELKVHRARMRPRFDGFVDATEARFILAFAVVGTFCAISIIDASQRQNLFAIAAGAAGYFFGSKSSSPSKPPTK